MDYQRLIIRHLSGETDPEEEQLLREWCRQSEANQQEYETMRKAWQLGGKVNSLPDPDRVYARIYARIENTSSKRAVFAWKPYLPAAAIITLLLLSSLLLWVFSPFAFDQELRQAQTLKGEQQQLQLPDGTVVYLNTESNLRFPASFGEGERRVILEGEAFFDVERDTLRPFIIELPEGSIRVLGTSFNVKAYAQDSKIVTTVSSGKVAFLHPDEKEKATLIEPNEKLSYSKAEKQVSKESTEVAPNLAWMENKIVFQAHSLGEISAELERYFDIVVVFENEQLRNCTMTGTFRKDSYQDILNTLAMTNTFKFREEGKRIVLSGKGCGGVD